MRFDSASAGACLLWDGGARAAELGVNSAARVWQSEGRMSYDVQVKRLRHFHRVRITGELTFDQLVSAVHLLGVESSGWELDRVLVDLRGVISEFSPAEQFRLGEEAAASLLHMRRIASLVPPHRVTRISEKAARRNGSNIQVFDDEAEAVAWLEEKA